MKLLKTLTVGLLAAASFGTASAAVTTLHIAGSTAFRNGATAAIIDYLSSNLAPGSSHVYALYSSSSPTSTAILGAGAALFANGTVGTSGNATIVIETYWTGSLAGVVDVVADNNNTTSAYIDPSGLDSTALSAINASTGYATTSPYGGGAGVASSHITTSTGVPDVAFSDSYQGTIAKELATGSFASGTTSIGGYTSISALATACASGKIIDSGTSANAGGAGFVGIVPFQWVMGNVSDSSVVSAVTNIGQQTARGLITNGYVPQSYLTGGSGTNDTSNYFYLVGRNEDSGTRIGALSESQFGVNNSPIQFQVTGNPVSSLAKYPVTALNTEPGIVWNTTGHSGYASGGNVASALEATENSAALPAFTGQSSENTGGSYLIGYVGATDANSAIKAGGHALSYNGVPLLSYNGTTSENLAAVQNGQYTFWTYEHVYRLASISSTTLGNIADGIADNVYLTDADVASDGTHQGTSGSIAGGILDNASSPVLVFRNAVEGGPLSNY
jgi:hypothetical protein